jgi:TfoX/Sxy family transcriptional regulator of competence genes
MAYDEQLAHRVRQVLVGMDALAEKSMFGAVGFMLRGNMACGVQEERLIVRVGPERYQEALQRSHARPFDMTGRPIKGWVFVSAEGLKSDDDLREWVQQGVDFALSLPPR